MLHEPSGRGRGSGRPNPRGYTGCGTRTPRASKVWRKRLPDTASLAHAIIDLLSEKQASDIVLLEITQVSSIADFFVIATATSGRQLNSLVASLDEELDNNYPRPRRSEGTSDSGWMLLDYGDVVVHLFAPEERAYYRLESLWSRSVPLVRFQ